MKSFDNKRGFGFICVTSNTSNEIVFVHKNDIKTKKKINIGDRLKFNIKNPKNAKKKHKRKAINVVHQSFG